MQRQEKAFIYHFSGQFGDSKVLFTDRYTWQNFRLQFLGLRRVYLQDPEIVNESFAMCIGQ